MCLKTPTGPRLARCEMVLNNTSWTKIHDDCPAAKPPPVHPTWLPEAPPWLTTLARESGLRELGVQWLGRDLSNIANFLLSFRH